MSDGKHCPSCGKDIGVWPVFSAGLPNRVRCPHCKARLEYRGVVGLVILLSVLGVALLAASVYAVQHLDLTGGPQRALAFAGLVLGLWVPVELAVALYLRSTKELSRTDGQ
jgi:hypothetical protein